MDIHRHGFNFTAQPSREYSHNTMRLINTRTLELEEFHDKSKISYAILSHTWEQDEVTYQDWQDLSIASKKAGYSKIKSACQAASQRQLEYLWVDTNCIDKTSSSELSEAINSMFAWYRDANVCFAYLADIPPRSAQGDIPDLSASRWFTRGWTLQELLASTRLIFFARDWSIIETLVALAPEVSAITRIDVDFIIGEQALSQASVAKKMSWLSTRVTTRIEDMAYCMLGIFDINMPLLYGEGSRAFIRLQEEIIKVSNDHTIFCWIWSNIVPINWVSMLAPYPLTFRHSGHFIRKRNIGGVKPFSMTNAGLSISLPLIQASSYYFAILNAADERNPDEMHACIPLSGFLDNENSEQNLIMQRQPFPSCPMFASAACQLCHPSIFVRSRTALSVPHGFYNARTFSGSLYFAFLLTLGDVRTLLNKQLQSSAASRALSGICLLERLNSSFRIITFPPDRFDHATSLLIFPDPPSHISGVIVQFGVAGDRSRHIYLSIRAVPGSDKPRLYCFAFNTKESRVNLNDRITCSTVLQQLQDKAAKCLGDTYYAAGPGGSEVGLGRSFNVNGVGLICPAFVTFEGQGLGRHADTLYAMSIV
jgi:hypothetical protein